MRSGRASGCLRWLLDIQAQMRGLFSRARAILGQLFSNSSEQVIVLLLLLISCLSTKRAMYLFTEDNCIRQRTKKEQKVQITIILLFPPSLLLPSRFDHLCTLHPYHDRRRLRMRGGHSREYAGICDSEPADAMYTQFIVYDTWRVRVVLRCHTAS